MATEQVTGRLNGSGLKSSEPIPEPSESMESGSESDRYLCRSISRACEVFDAFRDAAKALSLTEIASKTGLSVATHSEFSTRWKNTASSRGSPSGNMS